LSKIAERFFSIWTNAGMEAWYIESDIDIDLFVD
jgi:hypothetical protein